MIHLGAALVCFVATFDHLAFCHCRQESKRAQRELWESASPYSGILIQIRTLPKARSVCALASNVKIRSHFEFPILFWEDFRRAFCRNHERIRIRLKARAA